MAVAIAPVLASITLPIPKEQPYVRHYRGGTLMMADGSIVHDLVDTLAKHRFRLRWEYLDDSELATVANAWDAVKDTKATYVSVRNTTHTVIRPEGGEFEIDVVVIGGGQMAYHVAFELIQVL